uniref:coiled-coil domain-containing protein 138-like n=1 Tax=Podarcis muralis TaxID=64176 RepID=UPI0010A0056A
KKTITSKSYKIPINSHIYDLLTVLMDWISDQHLSKLVAEEEKASECLLTGVLASSRTTTHRRSVPTRLLFQQLLADMLFLVHTSAWRKHLESVAPTLWNWRCFFFPSCALETSPKFLPLVAEQFQWMPFVNPDLHMHVVKFIYWAIRQLDGGTQYATMTSTMRRLGEDLFKGVVPKGCQYISPEHTTDPKPKSAAFFKSSNLPLRLVSTLIIIKTVTQADYLAQAFDSLCVDLKTDEGKALFLDYQAVPIILSHIRISSKGVLSNAVDSLLQMTTQSSKCAK